MSRTSASVGEYVKALVVVLVAAGVALAGAGTAAAIGGQDTATSDVAPQAQTVSSSSVAASATSANASATGRTASSTSVGPGSTVTVTLTLTGSGETPSIEESFSPSVADATISSVTVNGNDANTILETADSTGALATFVSDVSSGATIKVEYELTIPSSAAPGQNFTLSANLTGTQESSVEDTVVTVGQNDPPKADAGPDQTIIGGSGNDVFLSATGSTDPDGDSLNYSWTQTGGPSVSLSGASSGTPSFAPLSVSSTTTLTFEVTVSDGSGGTDTDTVNVTLEPSGSDPAPQRSVPSSISPGGSATVTLTVNASTDSMSITESFSPAFESATLKGVTVDGQSASPFLTQVDPTGAVVTFQSGAVSAGDTVTVKYEVSVASNASIGDVYSISGDFTSGQTNSTGTSQIVVEKSQKPTDRYDENNNGIEVTELGQAASDYIKGNLSIKELGEIAAAYVQNSG